MIKPLIFISHATCDQEIALRVRDIIHKGFLGQFDIFLSSEDILAGDEWRENVKAKLRLCCILLIVATSRSAHGAWVNYEIGAAAIQDKRLIVLVSPGYSHKDLPTTYDTRQAVDGSKPRDYMNMVKALTAFLPNTLEPEIDFSDFIEYFLDFEKRASSRNSLIEVLDHSSMIQDRLPAWLRQTSISAILCGIHFQKSLSDHRYMYHDAINRGVRFKFAVLDPKSRYVRETASLIGMDYQELKEECMSGLTMLKNLQVEAKDLSGNGLEPAVSVFLLNRRPNARYYIFDQDQADGILAFTPYTELRPSHSPTYVYGAMHSAASQYIESCNEVFKRYAKPYQAQPA